ncbi:MAG: hypothetical protein JNM33_13015 [Rubrivivax sp.]|nr:hypothetical protein [Rubrivivax sp.]
MKPRILSLAAACALIAPAVVAAWWWMDAPDAPQRDSVPTPAPVGPTPSAPIGASPSSASQAGSQPASANAAAARFRLVGMASNGQQGMALIQVDGQPARTFKVGDVLEGNLVLLEVSGSGAVIGPRGGGALVDLRQEPAVPQAMNRPAGTQPDAGPPRDLSDGSAESAAALNKLGARNAPMKPPTAAEQASAAQSSTPTDPGRWHPPGQP